MARCLSGKGAQPMRDPIIVSEQTIDFALRLTAVNLELEERNRELVTENAGLREDNAWLRELTAAAVDRLHESHVAALGRQARLNRLLDELRTIRAARRTQVGSTYHLPAGPTDGDDPAEAPCQ
jgi:hypothetical protein